MAVLKRSVLTGIAILIVACAPEPESVGGGGDAGTRARTGSGVDASIAVDGSDPSDATKIDPSDGPSAIDGTTSDDAADDVQLTDVRADGSGSTNDAGGSG